MEKDNHKTVTSGGSKKNDPIMEVTVAETVLWFSPKSKQEELRGMPNSKVIAWGMVEQ